jgi:hypothetical protein
MRVRPTISRLALIVAVLVAAQCLVSLAQAAMPVGSSPDCPSGQCDQQLACRAEAQPQASPGSSALVVAIPAAVEGERVLMATDTMATGSPPVTAAWRPFAPFGPRSPPLA